jgi:hypothetical protein
VSEYTDVSEVHTASIIALMMEAIRPSETLIYSKEATQHYIPEVYKLSTLLYIVQYPFLYLLALRDSLYLSSSRWNPK